MVSPSFSPTFYPLMIWTRSPGSFSNLFKAKNELKADPGLALVPFSFFLCVTLFPVTYVTSDLDRNDVFCFWTCSQFSILITALGLMTALKVNFQHLQKDPCIAVPNTGWPRRVTFNYHLLRGSHVYVSSPVTVLSFPDWNPSQISQQLAF